MIKLKNLERHLNLKIEELEALKYLSEDLDNEIIYDSLQNSLGNLKTALECVERLRNEGGE